MKGGGEKSRQWRSPRLAVLTYSFDRSPVQAAAAVPEERHVLACLGWVGETAGLLLTLPHLSRLDLVNSYVREKVKLLKYSKAP